MVAKFSQSSHDYSDSSLNNDTANILVSGLSKLPDHWALTPVTRGKRPYRQNWQSEKPIEHKRLTELIKNGEFMEGKDKKPFKVYPQGYGLRTGEVSGGILAIDADGQAAHEKLNQFGGLPKTVAFTSGKPGRCQYLVQVPKEFWSVIKTQKINTKVKDGEGKEQLLEFRWNGCQSVLPPSVHPETGSYKWVNSPQDCEVAQCPSWIIEYFLNQSTPTTPKATNQPQPAIPTDDVPLYQCLPKVDRQLIDSGVGEGSRNDNGYKLACSLIGTVSFLTSENYRYSGDPRHLFDEYCSKCSPPIDSREADNIWNSAEKSNPSATLTRDYIENCIKAWRCNQSKKINPKSEQVITPKATNVITLAFAIDYNSVKSDYIKLLDTGALKSALSQFKTDVNQKYYPNKLDSFLNDVEAEYRKSEDDENTKNDVKEILDSSKTELQIKDFLPEDLANAILLFCKNQSLPQASALMALLSTASGLHPVGTKVIIGNPNNGFVLNPSINHAVVGESGAGKTPLVRGIVSNPLKGIRRAEKARFKAEMEQYTKDLSAWEKSGQLGTQPEPPSPLNNVFITDGTIEGLKALISKNPDYSILNVVDELASLFAGFGQYKRGKGNDAQEFLKMFDGSEIVTARASGITNDIDDYNVAYLGGMQPSILQKHFQTGESDGLLARFTFSILSDARRYLPDEDAGTVDITGILQSIYKRLIEYSPSEYSIRGEAYKYYQQVDKYWTDQSAALPNGALKEFLLKTKGLLGKLAINLHLVRESSNQSSVVPSTDIPLARVKEAKLIIDFLLTQLRVIHAQIECENTQSAIVAMIRLSEKRLTLGALGNEGWVNSREIIHNQTAKGRMKTSEIKELMVKAADMGYGKLRGTGTKLEFRSTNFVGDLLAIAKEPSKVYTPMDSAIGDKKVLAIVGDLLAIAKEPESIATNGLESHYSEIVGDVGDFPEISEDTTNQKQMMGDLVNPDENLSNISPTSPTKKVDVAEKQITNGFKADLQSPTNRQQIANSRQQSPTKNHRVNQEDVDAEKSIDLSAIDFSDCKSVVKALQQAYAMGDGHQKTVGTIYSKASLNVKTLIDGLSGIPDDAKKYIQDCYELVKNDQSRKVK